MELIYDLRADKAHVRAMQEATKKRPHAGLAPDPALVGSWRWWRAIDSGRYPSTIVEGRIAKVYWASMGDWPMFTVVSSDGPTSDWTREGDFTRYVEGLGVRLQYVLQRFKDSIPAAALGGNHETKVITRIWIEPSDRRSSLEVSGPFGRDKSPGE
jgi:hypothetical protein